MEDKENTELPEITNTNNNEKQSVEGSYIENLQKLQDILKKGLGNIRNKEILNDAQEKLDRLLEETKNNMI